MKHFKITGLFLIMTVLLSSRCTIDLRHDCTNNLKYYPFPYSNGDKVEFKNENGTSLVSTVEIITENLGKTEDDDPGHYKCGGYRSMTINGFTYRIDQDVNFNKNATKQSVYFDNYNNFKLNDTIKNYNFRNSTIPSFHYIKIDDSSDLKSKYIEFNLSEDYKLLNFTLRKNGKTEKWVLQ